MIGQRYISPLLNCALAIFRRSLFFNAVCQFYVADIQLWEFIQNLIIYKLPHIFDSNITKAHKPLRRYNNLVINNAVLKVLLLFYIEFNIICCAIFRWCPLICCWHCYYFFTFFIFRFSFQILILWRYILAWLLNLWKCSLWLGIHSTLAFLGHFLQSLFLNLAMLVYFERFLFFSAWNHIILNFLLLPIFSVLWIFCVLVFLLLFVFFRRFDIVFPGRPRIFFSLLCNDWLYTWLNFPMCPFLIDLLPLSMLSSIDKIFFLVCTLTYLLLLILKWLFLFTFFLAIFFAILIFFLVLSLRFNFFFWPLSGFSLWFFAPLVTLLPKKAFDLVFIFHIGLLLSILFEPIGLIVADIGFACKLVLDVVLPHCVFEFVESLHICY